MWLSEGFATYFTHLFTEHYRGRDAMVAGLKRDSHDRPRRREKPSPDTPVDSPQSRPTWSKVLNRLVYQKGGWVLHMLRGRIGADTFWTGIREYYRRYRNGTRRPTISAR